MTGSNDVADLLQINEMLYSYVNDLIIDGWEPGSPFINILSIGADELKRNKNDLNRLLNATEWNNKFTTSPLLNEWKVNTSSQPGTTSAEENVEFEIRVEATLEAYKTALNAALLTDTVQRYTLMDQKCFLQRFLIDVIKCRELYAVPRETAMLV